MKNVRKSADKNLVRRVNIALILSYLRTSHSQTRASLSAITGLTRATVSSLVEDLIGLNLVRETGLQLSQNGRPGTGLELNPSGGCAIGVEIGVGFVAVVLSDFVANILWRHRVEFDTTDIESVMEIATGLAVRAEKQSRAFGVKLLGIGLGLPGLVKMDEGLLKFAPNLGWFDIPFQAPWEEQFGVPVYVINEAKAAALGEHYFGIAAGYDDFIYLSASPVGLGAGIILGGKLFHGQDGYAGEIGHMVLDPAGPQCACGRHGCWEKVAGSQAVIKYIVEQYQNGHSTKALDLVDGNIQRLTTDIVVQAANDGDNIAKQALSQVSYLFGIGMTNLINIFNPELIVVGGTFARALTTFLPIVETVINQEAFRALAANVDVKISQLGDDACLMGAVASVFDVVFTNPTQSVNNAMAS